MLLATAKAKPITSAPGTWQTTPYCNILIKSSDDKEIFKDKCYGVTVSKKGNVNIHFEGSHPSARNTITSYVLVEGPFSVKRPVEALVMYVGKPNQVIIPVSIGYCTMEPSAQFPSSTFIHCFATSEPGKNGLYLTIGSSALFSEPIVPNIAKELQ